MLYVLWALPISSSSFHTSVSFSLCALQYYCSLLGFSNTRSFLPIQALFMFYSLCLKHSCPLTFYLLNVFSWLNSQLIVNYLEKPFVRTRLSILNPVGSQRSYSVPHHWKNKYSPSWNKISCRVGVMSCNTHICLNQWPMYHFVFSPTITIKHMGTTLQKYGWYFFFLVEGREMMGLLNDTSTGLEPILRIPIVLGFNSYGRNIPTKAKIFTLNENWVSICTFGYCVQIRGHKIDTNNNKKCCCYTRVFEARRYLKPPPVSLW